MNRQTVVLLSAALLSLTACDKADEPKADADAQQAKTDADKPKADEVEPEGDQPDAKEAPTDARMVASGLGKGERFAPFEIINCATGDEYCQVCKFGSSPKIMAAGTFGDADFEADIKAIDALVQEFGDDKVKAFAVVGEIKDGKLVTPVANKDAMRAKAKELRESLGVSIPIVIPAPDGEKANTAWEDHYNVTASRTVMFADGRNKVHYSEVAPADMAGLKASVQGIVES